MTRFESQSLEIRFLNLLIKYSVNIPITVPNAASKIIKSTPEMVIVVIITRFFLLIFPPESLNSLER